MSSRAAAGRKRLAPGAEPPKPSSSKGFFSRSKPTSATAPQLDLATQFPAGPIPPIAPPPARREPNDLWLYRTQDTRHGSPSTGPPRPAHYVPPPSPAPKKMTSGPKQGLIPSSVYPSPTPNEHVPRHISQLNAQSSRGNGVDNYQESEITYVEASYQPPPPIHASYQPPPPPIVGNSLNGQRALPSIPTKHGPSTVDTLAAFPPPPTTSHFSLPSPFPSPRQTPLSLRRDSVASSELPTYSSSGHDDYSIDRPPLQISIHDFPHSPHARQEYVQYNESSPYPSPPSSQPLRLTSPPLTLLNPPNPSSNSLPIENDSRRLWYLGTPGGQTSEPSSPSTTGHFSPPSPINSRPPRPPESVSGSSNSGGQSPTFTEPVAQPPTPAFVFPGSRSVAKPKVPKRIQIKGSGKSQILNGSNGISPPPALILSSPTRDTTYLEPPHSAEAAGSERYMLPDGHGRLPVVQNPNHANSYSDNHSVISNDSIGNTSSHSGSGTTRGSSNAGSSSAGSITSVSPGASTSQLKPQLFPAGRSRAQPSKVPQGINLKSLAKRSSKSSSNSKEGEREERSRFMGILRKKKKQKAPESIQLSAMAPGPIIESVPSPENNTGHDESQVDIYTENRERVPRIRSRIGSYPLDPYDPVLLDNDRHTGELLVRLNPTGSPSFHNYGNTPPVSVLDLGCGQGHWVVDAAIAWKGYGTKVTGYDLVDISEGLRPWAVEQGVVDNIRFVRGNFLSQRLPFSDDTFDLVRMSCLALCITSDAWSLLLKEVCRVLEVGGRLELIDDLIIFPYGTSTPSLQLTPAQVESVAPRLDITIPSSSFSTFNIYDGQTINPGLGTSIMEDDADDFHDLYGVDEEADIDDTATLNGRESQTTPLALRNTPQPVRRGSGQSGISSRSWDRAFATSQDLEALFEHMLMHKFGIKKDLGDFILDLMQEAFGHAREVKTMNLTLAPQESEYGSEVNVLVSPQSPKPKPSPSVRRESMGLSRSPGLVLWPSTFLPMEQSEIEIHASKHLRMLLSCKNSLLEHALEATDDGEIDEESVLEALWEYEHFLRHRFNLPQREASDAASIRESIAESVTSDGQESLWEIQSEFRQCFAWQDDSSPSESPLTPNAPTLSDNRAVTPTSKPVSQSPQVASDPDTASLNATPIYSRDELTHVRTLRIYEAIKLDHSIFGPSM